MKKILYHGSLVFLLSFFLFSCKKGNDNPVPPPVTSMLVKKISNTESNFNEFEYNAVGQLIKWKSQWQN